MPSCRSYSPRTIHHQAVPSRGASSSRFLQCLPTRANPAASLSHMLEHPFTNYPKHSTSSRHHHTLIVCAASSGSSTDLSVSDSLDILDLGSAAATDAGELRRAYYRRMREIHPDVNPDQDTTESAALVNAAYTALLKVCHCCQIRHYS